MRQQASWGSPGPHPVTAVSDPITVLSDPITVLSDPITVLSNPISVLTDPITMLSDPITVLPDPITVLSDTAHTVPTTLPLTTFAHDLATLTCRVEPCTFGEEQSTLRLALLSRILQ